MGCHITEIEKGVLGTPSKIREEYEEFVDSLAQNNPLMALLELSDLIGAIEAYAENYGLTLNDLVIMQMATKKAFNDGSRK